MKKIISILLVFILACSCVNAEGIFNEDTDAQEQELPTQLNVVNSTKVTGAFFTDLWSMNTSDIDVRAMLHGLSTCDWVSESNYAVNPTVVKDLKQSQNDDGSKTFFIAINEGLKFSDGSDLTAKDFVFSILLQANSVMNELGAADTGYYYIEGFKDYHDGMTKELTGVRLYGDDMFSMTVSAEYLPFFYEKAYIDVIPYPINAIAPGCTVANGNDGCYIKDGYSENDAADAEEDIVYFDADLLNATLFGENGYATYPSVVAGPYTLVSYDAEKGYVEFKLNPYYPGNCEGIIPTIEDVTLSYALPEDAIAGYIDGTYNLVNKAVGLDVINEGIAAEGVYETYSRRGMGYINFDCQSEILSDVHVRHAISCAMNKDGFTEEYLGEFGMPVYGYYGIGQWMVQAATGAFKLDTLEEEEQKQWETVVLDELTTYSYDLEAAKQELAEAGWKYSEDGSDYESGIRYAKQDEEFIPLSLTIAVADESPAAVLVAQYLTESFAETGAELVICNVKFDDMIADIYSEGDHEFDMVFLGCNFPMIFDPILDFSTDPALFGITNMSRYADEKLEELAMEMHKKESGDVLGYYLAWYEFQKYFGEVLPVLPLYSDVYVDFHVDALKNYEILEWQGWPWSIIAAEFSLEDAETNESGEELFMD